MKYDVPFRAFVLGNVRGTRPYMSRDDVLEDLYELRREGSVVALNEMWRYADEVREVFGNGHWEILIKPGCSTGFAVRKDRFEVRAKGYWPEHGHVSGPRWRKVISDKREIAWGTLFPVEDPAARFLLMVIHQTPSAWYGWLPRKWKLAVRRFWYTGRDNIVARAENSILRYNRPVLIMGDWNYKPKPLGERLVAGQWVKHITASSGILKIMLIGSKTREWVVDPDGKREFNLNSDHHGLRGRAAMRKKARR